MRSIFNTKEEDFTKEEKRKLILLYIYASDVREFYKDEKIESIFYCLKWWIKMKLPFFEFCSLIKSHGYIVQDFTTVKIGKELK
jgi:hypothetical protein